ncbi:hypothetical protein BDV06DRAFT_230592 [Aspergillus oleicola]
MVVTELACLRLKNSLPITDPSNANTHNNLLAGLKAQAEYTNANVSLLAQIEDPSYIYIIGQWESVTQHMDEWIPSPKNKDIMSGLSQDLELVWIQHLDLDTSEQTEGEIVERIPYLDSVIAIARYFISPGPNNKTGFEKTFNETKHRLRAFKRPRDAVGAFRVDTDFDEEGSRKEEFVLFSGWDTVEEHLSFAESDGFKEFSRIKDYMSRAEIKHASLVDRIA